MKINYTLWEEMNYMNFLMISYRFYDLGKPTE